MKEFLICDTIHAGRGLVAGVSWGLKRMYKIGEYVVYGIHGVCSVTDLEERVIDRKQVTYLVLEPVGQGGSRYLVPTHNAAAMSKLRYMLSRNDLERLLMSQQVHTDGWIADENRRKQVYRELINSGEPEKLLQMVRALYLHRDAQYAAGKKCHICDENFLRDAEKQIVGELCIVLDMAPEEAKDYLKRKLKEDA